MNRDFWAVMGLIGLLGFIAYGVHLRETGYLIAKPVAMVNNWPPAWELFK